MSIHGSPVIHFPATEIADLKAQLASGRTISSVHETGKHKPGTILMSSLGMLRVVGVRHVTPHELLTGTGAAAARVSGGTGDMLELKKLGNTTMNTSATEILQAKTASAMKVALSPGAWAALGTIGALGLGAAVATPLAISAGGHYLAGQALDEAGNFLGGDAGSDVVTNDGHHTVVPATHTMAPAAQATGNSATDAANATGRFLQDHSNTAGWLTGKATHSTAGGLAGAQLTDAAGNLIQQHAGDIGNAADKATDAYSKLITPAPALTPAGGIPDSYTDYKGHQWSGHPGHGDPRNALLIKQLEAANMHHLADRIRSHP